VSGLSQARVAHRARAALDEGLDRVEDAIRALAVVESE